MTDLLENTIFSTNNNLSFINYSTNKIPIYSLFKDFFQEELISR